MNLKFLGSGGSDRNGCPTLYAKGEGYVVQAWRTDRVGTVELPHLHETAVEVPKAERTYYGGVSRTR